MITVYLPKETIDAVFEEAQNQHDYLIELHRMTVPDFEAVANLNHFPKVSPKTGEYIFNKAYHFDREHHPDVISGGLWMSMGFGEDKSIDQDWIVVIDEEKITYA